MKQRIRIGMCAVMAMALLALTPGCTTTPTGQSVPDPLVLHLTAQEATAIGARFYLQSNPEARGDFELARQSLRALVAVGKGSPADLQEALSKLPIKQLQGSNGVLIVSTAVVLIDRAGKELAKFDKTQVWSFYVQPIAEGILDGLNQAMGPEQPGASIAEPWRDIARVRNWRVVMVCHFDHYDSHRTEIRDRYNS